jgi:hypothetical protein
MAGCGVAMLIRNVKEHVVKTVWLVEADNSLTSLAGEVMVVRRKGIAQFELVLPAVLYASNDT